MLRRGAQRRRCGLCSAVLRRAARQCHGALPLLVGDEAAAQPPPGAVIIDCSNGGEGYRRAHIPGAIHLGLCDRSDAAGRNVKGSFLKNPDELLSVISSNQLQELMGAAGVGAATHVIAYDDHDSLYASRLWWVLALHGHSACSVLDGGWRRWCAAGRPVATGGQPPPPCWGAAPVAPSHAPQRFAAAEDAAAAAAAGQLWDCRTAEQFAGRDSQGSSRAGRIPGARHLDWRDCVDPATARLRSKAELTALFAAAGIDPQGPCTVVCQRGIRAAFGAFLLEAVFGNKSARVYDKSMAEWNAPAPGGGYAAPVDTDAK